MEEPDSAKDSLSGVALGICPVAPASSEVQPGVEATAIFCHDTGHNQHQATPDELVGGPNRSTAARDQERDSQTPEACVRTGRPQ